MDHGARITDEVDHFRQVGDLRSTVRIVRTRTPERLRWRAAVATVTQIASELRGKERLRIEEPVREVVLDLEDHILRRESVLDARRVGVDLDRGEILPHRNRWDLSRTGYLTGLDHEALGRYVTLPADYNATVDTGAVVLVARSLAKAHKSRADKLAQRVPAQHQIPMEGLRLHEQYMLDRANFDWDVARRWSAFAQSILDGSR
jgi:hypothetical protein